MTAAPAAAMASIALVVTILGAAIPPAHAGRSLQHVLPAGGVSVSVSLPPQLGGLLQQLPVVSELLGLTGSMQAASLAVDDAQPGPGFSLNILVQPGVPLLEPAEDPMSTSSQHARAPEPADEGAHAAEPAVDGAAAAAGVLSRMAEPWPRTAEPADNAADVAAASEPVAAQPADGAASGVGAHTTPVNDAAGTVAPAAAPVTAEAVQQPPVLPAEQPAPDTPATGVQPPAAAPTGEQPGAAAVQPSPVLPAAGAEQPAAPAVGEQLPVAPAVQPSVPSEQPQVPVEPAASEQQQPPVAVPTAPGPAAPATDGQLNSSSTAPSSGSTVAAQVDLTKAPAACTADLIRNTSWGVASAAYQIEGGWDADGKGPNIWDVFTNSSAQSYRLGRIKRNATGNIAIDHYHRYKEDYKLMADMGINMHRFSFSWSRILPEGRAGSPINMAGIEFYDRLINEMIANNITPVATMYHWDLPQALQDAYGGFQSEQLITDFDAFASILFEHFGDRIKSWITFNEPPMICDAGYNNGQFAPGIMGGRKAMFRCGHILLLAHAAAAKTYREQYQAQQKGKIALTTNIVWAEPLTDSPEDKRAANNKMERELGWLTDPLFFGDYPASNKLALGSDLPSFTPEQQAALKGSVDAIGVNVYTARYVSADPNNSNGFRQSTRGKDGQPIGAKADADWHYITPNALAGVLTWIGDRYDRPETWVTEFGTSVPGEAHWPANQVLNDTFRTSMYHGYLGKACAAITQHHLNVPKVFAWTSFDNFEWVEGYEVKYGMIHVDFETGSLNRTVKDSGWWWSRNFFRHSKDPRAAEAELAADAAAVEAVAS